MQINQSEIIAPLMQSLDNSEQQISTFVNKITPLAHERQQYQNLLTLWNQYREQRQGNVKKWKQIMQLEKKQQKNQKRTTMCMVCYDELPVKTQWCRLCGLECCSKCISRWRVIQNTNNSNKNNSQSMQPVPTCETCDKKYIQARLELQYQKELQLRQQGLNKINDINKLLLTQSMEYEKSGQKQQQHKCELRNLVKTISHLESLNESAKLQNIQIKRKISWGEDVKEKLKSKYRKIAKQLKIRSFSESSAYNDMRTQSINSKYIHPPTAYNSDLNRTESENLNSSVLNSVLEEQSRMITGRGRCCVVCSIM